MRRIKFVTTLLACALSIAAYADDDAGITPYRPSVSSPAQLPLPGQLEFEIGALSTRTDDARRDSAPYQFKLAFNPQWGVLLGGEAIVSDRDGTGHRERGFGDTIVVIKRAFLIDDATAFGLELGAKMPTAKDTIGGGKADYTLNSIYSKDLGKVHMDANLNFTRLGLIEPDTARIQTGLSASFSMPIAENWSATGELSGTSRRGVPGTAQLLAAVTYMPSKRMAIDFGLARGLNNTSQDWSFFSGIVVPIAKLW